jgi:addiction module HigA family antidote
MTNPLLNGLGPTHPGEILREDVLPALGKPKTEIARALHVSRQHLYDILNEQKPITSQMALRIGRLTRTSPEMWLRMQCAYDLATLEPKMAEELELIPILKAA